MSESTPLKEDKSTGTTSDAADLNDESPSYPKIVITLAIMLAIGTGLAYASIRFDGSSSTGSNDKLASKIATIRELDLQWLYLALVVLGRTISLLNFVPTGYKSGMKGNIRSNPFFYQTTDGSKTRVVFQDDGAIGMYNRSNRSIQHMVENSGGFFAAIGPVGYLFPKQTFAATLSFCFGRILHQKGYTSGYGSHAPGFVLHLLSLLTVEGLALLAFLKAQGILA